MSQKISKISGRIVRTKYKVVLNKAGDRYFPIPTVESNLSGRFDPPKKKDPDAMNSPKHMRQRCREMRLTPATPPLTSMRTSPAAASRHTEPMKRTIRTATPGIHRKYAQSVRANRTLPLLGDIYVDGAQVFHLARVSRSGSTPDSSSRLSLWVLW